VGSVESNPALRDVPGIPHSLRLDDILPASGKLDNKFDLPRRGRMAMRTWAARIGRRDCGGSRQATATILGCGVKLTLISPIGCDAFFWRKAALQRNFHKCE
jgi:hypothetical protein